MKTDCSCHAVRSKTCRKEILKKLHLHYEPVAVNEVFEKIPHQYEYYLAYLIVQCILMGATIDYAILFTNNYRESRRKNDVRESLVKAYATSMHTILTSGSDRDPGDRHTGLRSERPEYRADLPDDFHWNAGSSDSDYFRTDFDAGGV